MMPIPNGFLAIKDLRNKEEKYPLSVCVCEDCHLVQLTHVIPAKIMFKNYLYIPSTSLTMLKHFNDLVEDIRKKSKLSSEDLIVDIGSNDGTLLTFFKKEGMKVLGIDPSENLSLIAKLKGIENVNKFFTRKQASKIIKKYGRAKIITATNVMPHVHNLHNFFSGVSDLLTDDGIFIAEFPYVPDLFRKNEFDTIYHEHLSYFSLQPLKILLDRYHLRINELKKIPVHGGSLRLYIAKKSLLQGEKQTDAFLENEKKNNFGQLKTYKNFSRRVRKMRIALVTLLKELKRNGKKIVGYGASAKGNVLLNYCNLDTRTIEYIVDSISYKQGKFTPGTHVPIFSEERLQKDMPDYALLLSWNFADEILRKQVAYREKGGRFIITIPYLRIES